MSHPPLDDATDRGRRLVGAAGAALAMGAATHAVAATSGSTKAVTGVPLPTRARWVLQKTWAIPKSSNNVYVTPFGGAPVFNDGDVTMNQDYTLTVNTSGLYLLSLGFDWADNPNQQVGLRINGLERTIPASPPGQFKPGQLTIVVTKNDRIGQYDVSGSNCPWTSRYTGSWKVGIIGKNAVVSQDVTLATAGIINLGDVATASHTGIDLALGDAAAALVVTAKVVGPDTVRVSIWNTSQTTSISVPSGTLNVLAMTSQKMTGDAPLGRSLLVSASEQLSAGDLLYATFKSTQGGDQLLASPDTFIHIERWA